jgi:hypothetical protein
MLNSLMLYVCGMIQTFAAVFCVFKAVNTFALGLYKLNS